MVCIAISSPPKTVADHSACAGTALPASHRSGEGYISERPAARFRLRVGVDRALGDAPPGVLAYGATREEAVVRLKALVLRVLAERLKRGEAMGELYGLFKAA